MQPNDVKPLVDLSDVTFVGHGLSRPESVQVDASGTLYTADFRGGIARFRPEEAPILIKAQRSAGEPPLRPNGIALEAPGRFLIADISDERAGVWRMHDTGLLEPFLLEVEGTPLPPTNFVHIDDAQRVWLTVSTRVQPRARDYRPDADSGFIVLVDERGARVVADGLAYTNEARVSPDGRWLYANETFGRRLVRFEIRKNGDLGPRETVSEFGHGTYPDGLAFDIEGGIWIVSIVSNRVLRLSPDGQMSLVLEDADPEHVAWVEEAFQNGTMDRPHLDTIRSRSLRSISSIAFGGPDGRTTYLGCLLGDAVATFRSPVAGRG